MTGRHREVLGIQLYSVATVKYEASYNDSLPVVDN